MDMQRLNRMCTEMMQKRQNKAEVNGVKMRIVPAEACFVDKGMFGHR